MAVACDIVIYEDDLLTWALLKEWLAEAGLPARLGNARCARRDAPCSLVIMSVYNPKQTGAACVRDIQAAHPGTPVIAISGHFRPGLTADGATARALEVRQVVAKPLSREELLAAVRGIIGASA
jgi:DNA-binding response OmpR family regulator